MTDEETIPDPNEQPNDTDQPQDTGKDDVTATNEQDNVTATNEQDNVEIINVNNDEDDKKDATESHPTDENENENKNNDNDYKEGMIGGVNDQKDDGILIVELNQDIYTALTILFHLKQHTKLTTIEIFIFVCIALLTAVIQIVCIFAIGMEFIDDSPLLVEQEMTFKLIVTRIAVTIALSIHIAKSYGDALNIYILLHNELNLKPLLYFPVILTTNGLSCALLMISVTIINVTNSIPAILEQGLLLFFILEIDEWAYIFVSNQSFMFNHYFFCFRLKREHIKDKYLLNNSGKAVFLFACFILVTYPCVIELIDYHIIDFCTLVWITWIMIVIVLIARYCWIHKLNGNEEVEMNNTVNSAV